MHTGTILGQRRRRWLRIVPVFEVFNTGCAEKGGKLMEYVSVY